MNSPRYISFDLEKYKSKNEMFGAIGALLQILTDNRYVCSVRYEDCGVYRVEFDIENPSLATFELWHKIGDGEDNE